MNKATKGALAAVAAGTLMLGGAGTLAYWNGTSNVDGATINSGELDISDTPVCTGAGLHDWQFDGGDPFNPGTDSVVPGDTITKVCNLTLSLAGTNIGAALSLDSPTYETANGLTAALPATATFQVDGAPYTAPIQGAGEYDVTVTISVPFDYATATNTSQDLAAHLEDVTIQATQTNPNA